MNITIRSLHVSCISATCNTNTFRIATLSSYILTTYNLPITPICSDTKGRAAQYYPENQSRSISTACEAINTAVPNVTSTGSAYEIQSPKQTEPRTGLLNGLNASESSSTPQASLTTSFLSPQPHNRVASRESRISLPDEARRYYEKVYMRLAFVVTAC